MYRRNRNKNSVNINIKKIYPYFLQQKKENKNTLKLPKPLKGFQVSLAIVLALPCKELTLCLNFITSICYPCAIVFCNKFTEISLGC